MESDICQILFYVFAVAALICSIAVVAARNPVNSAMNMALCFGFVAAILFGMGAQFLGIVQLVVYAGAILVLFLFIIMMLDVKAEERSLHNTPAALAGVAVAAVVAAIITSAAWNLPGARDLRCPAKSLCNTISELAISTEAPIPTCGDPTCTDPACAPAPICTPATVAPYGGPLPQLCPVAATAAAGGNPETATSIPDTKLVGLTLFTRYNIAFVILGFALLSGTVGAIALSRKLRQD